MILTITLIIFFLVAVNFLLLIFSSNKIMKKEKTKKTPVVLHFNKHKEEELAPTGS
ncbi:MAG: hypothetical protein ACK5MZ_08200 [Aestuariibaculum sp.]